MHRLGAILQIVAAALLAQALGCSAPQAGVTVFADDRAAIGLPPTNLLLGSRRAHTELGELYALRSDWPAVDNGYRFETITHFFDEEYDDQSIYYEDGSYYSRLRGGVSHGVEIK